MNVISTCQCVNLILTVTTLLGATSAFVMLAILEMVSSTALVSLDLHNDKSLINCLLDINECEVNAHDCDENAECTDAIGSFTCTCNFGYSGNGTYCCESC